MNNFNPQPPWLYVIALQDYHSGLITIDRHMDHRGAGITLFLASRQWIKLTRKLT